MRRFCCRIGWCFRCGEFSSSPDPEGWAREFECCRGAALVGVEGSIRMSRSGVVLSLPLDFMTLCARLGMLCLLPLTVI